MSFFNKKFTFTQPDNETLVVRGWGNQFHAVFETLDGYTVVRTPAADGVYEYAQVAPSGHLEPSGLRPGRDYPEGLHKHLRPARGAKEIILRAVRKQKKAFKKTSAGKHEDEEPEEEGAGVQEEAAPGQGVHDDGSSSSASPVSPPSASVGDRPHGAPPATSTLGPVQGLCLLIDFPDLHGHIHPSDVNNFFNQKGYSGDNNSGSVYDYFNSVSGGAFKYNITATEWVTARKNRQYYLEENVPFTERAQVLVSDALADLKKTGFDFSSFSTDGAGRIKGLSVFYAGDVNNNWSKGLWPHSFHLDAPVSLSSGVKAFKYQITAISSELSLGTFCHENGHMVCDFPDLYDYGDDGTLSSGIGAFCLMCIGNVHSEKNPTRISVYLRYRAKWVTPRPITVSGQYTLRVGEALIFSRTSKEYFLFENRFAVDWDKHLPASGLAIWHIDENGKQEYQDATAAKHYECTLVQADGRSDMEKKKDYIGDAGDLFPARLHHGTLLINSVNSTHPQFHWWNGSPVKLDIRNISNPGSAITMDITVLP